MQEGTTLAKLKDMVGRAFGKSKDDDITTKSISDIIGQKAVEEYRKRIAEQTERQERKFDDFDALSAEIAARFGWDVYERWNNEEIDDEKMARFIRAERAREYEKISQLEAVVVAAVSACVRVPKKGRKPKGLDTAMKIIRENIEIIKGAM